MKEGNYTGARSYFYQAVAVCQEGEYISHEAWMYQCLANCAYEQGDKGEAMEWLRKTLLLFERLDEESSLIICLRSLARFSEDIPEQAAFYWSAYERITEERSHHFSTERNEQIASAFATLQTRLSEDALAAIREKVASLSLHQIIQTAFTFERLSP
jgi:tetratricopeptide (TPR) repeat protein